MANENLKAQKIYGKYIKELPQVTEVNDTDDIIIEDSTPITNRAKLGVLFDSIKKRIASTWRFTELDNQTIVEYASKLNENIPNIKAGSIIKTIAANNDSVAVFTDDDVNKMFGTSGSTNENTTVVFSDADSNATQSIHLDGTSYLRNKWYATYSKVFSGSTSIRINYIIVRA